MTDALAIHKQHLANAQKYYELLEHDLRKTMFAGERLPILRQLTTTARLISTLALRIHKLEAEEAEDWDFDITPQRSDIAPPPTTNVVPLNRR